MLGEFFTEIFGSFRNVEPEDTEQQDMIEYIGEINQEGYITTDNVVIQLGQVRFIKKDKETGHAILVLHMDNSEIDSGEPFDEVKALFE